MSFFGTSTVANWIALASGLAGFGTSLFSIARSEMSARAIQRQAVGQKRMEALQALIAAEANMQAQQAAAEGLLEETDELKQTQRATVDDLMELMRTQRTSADDDLRKLIQDWEDGVVRLENQSKILEEYLGRLETHTNDLHTIQSVVSRYIPRSRREWSKLVPVFEKYIVDLAPLTNVRLQDPGGNDLLKAMRKSIRLVHVIREQQARLAKVLTEKQVSG